MYLKSQYFPKSPNYHFQVPLHAEKNLNIQMKITNYAQTSKPDHVHSLISHSPEANSMGYLPDDLRHPAFFGSTHSP